MVDSELQQIVSDLRQFREESETKDKHRELINYLKQDIQTRFIDKIQDSDKPILAYYPEYHSADSASMVYMLALTQAWVEVAEENPDLKISHGIERNEQDTNFIEEKLSGHVGDTKMTQLVNFRSLILEENDVDIFPADPDQKRIFGVKNEQYEKNIKWNRKNGDIRDNGVVNKLNGMAENNDIIVLNFGNDHSVNLKNGLNQEYNIIEDDIFIKKPFISSRDRDNLVDDKGPQKKAYELAVDIAEDLGEFEDLKPEKIGEIISNVASSKPAPEGEKAKSPQREH